MRLELSPVRRTVAGLILGTSLVSSGAGVEATPSFQPITNHPTRDELTPVPCEKPMPWDPQPTVSQGKANLTRIVVPQPTPLPQSECWEIKSVPDEAVSEA